MKLKALTIFCGLALVYILFLMPGVHAQATTGFVKIANVTTLTYTDTACEKAVTCQYEVTAVGASGAETTADGPISVANSGTAGNVTLTWSDTCATGKTCGTASSYNVYAEYPVAPPVGLAGASN